MRHLHGQFGHRKIRTAPTGETGELPWKVNPQNRPELPKNTPSKLACATSFRTANAAAAGAVTSANNVSAKSNKPGTKRQREGHSGEAPCRALKLHRYRRDVPCTGREVNVDWSEGEAAGDLAITCRLGSAGKISELERVGPTRQHRIRGGSAIHVMHAAWWRLCTGCDTRRIDGSCGRAVFPAVSAHARVGRNQPALPYSPIAETGLPGCRRSIRLLCRLTKVTSHQADKTKSAQC